MTLSFTEVQGAFCITLKNGVYKQVAVYESNNELFAKHAGGFVRLLERYKTSLPTMVWKSIEGVEWVDTLPFGYIELKPLAKKAKKTKSK